MGDHDQEDIDAYKRGLLDAFEFFSKPCDQCKFRTENPKTHCERCTPDNLLYEKEDN